MKILILGWMDQTILMDLPLSILMAILLRVSAEDLFRLMSVCKAWRTLIRSTEFILEHLVHSATKGNNYLLCASKFINRGGCFKLISVENPTTAFELDNPIEFDYSGGTLVFASNGLVCLTAGSAFNITLYLCNPLIGKYKTIPASSIEFKGKDYTYLILGFGYHSRANDFKIVRIAYTKENYFLGKGNDVLNNSDPTEVVSNHGNTGNKQVHDAEVELYSLGADCWRKIKVDAFPWFLFDLHSRVLLNDTLHWMGQCRDGLKEKVVIVSFDLTKEVFQGIGLPSYLEHGDFVLGDTLIVYKDTLSLVALNPRNQPGVTCTIWVMREYRLVESWTKLFTIVDQTIHYPITVTMCDEILVNDPYDVSFYNLFNHRSKPLFLHTEPYQLDFLPVTASLALLGWEGDLNLGKDLVAGSQNVPVGEHDSGMQREESKRTFADQSDVKNVNSLAMDEPSTSTHMDNEGEG